MKRVVYPKVLVLLFRCSVAPGLAWVTRVIVQFNYCVIVLLVLFFGKFQFHFLIISKFSALLADLKSRQRIELCVRQFYLQHLESLKKIQK